MAQGLARLPPFTRICVALALMPLVYLELSATVYKPGLKADWRAFATDLKIQMTRSPSTDFTVFVKSSDPVRNTEVETARYYLPERCRVVPLEAADSAVAGLKEGDRVYVVLNERMGGLPRTDLFLLRTWSFGQFPGLMVYRVVVDPRRVPRSDSRRSAASGR